MKKFAWIFWSIAFIYGLLHLTACQDQSSDDSIVVGVATAIVLSDTINTFHSESTSYYLKAGSRVTVHAIAGNLVEVSADGISKGRMYRFDLCDNAEFKRRKSTGTIPTRTIGLGWDSKINSFFLSGGEIKIKNYEPEYEPGLGIYCDKSMQGKSTRIHGNKLTYNANALYYITKDLKFVTLTILHK